MAHHGDDDLTEARAVEKLLRVVPKKYSQIALAMETLLDFEDLTIEEVMGRLKAVDDREEAPPTESVTISGKLLYTKEQWLARQKEKGEGTNTSKERHRRPHGGKKGKPKGDRAGDGDGGD
jgi:hypothetical protein